jgi:16S rRNA (adenine1518-N6/adenine1519-N6)-dimethyltransferase
VHPYDPQRKPCLHAPPEAAADGAARVVARSARWARPVGDADGVTLTRTQVGELLTRHGLEPSRALGQNFVADPNTVRRIVRLAGVGEGDRVVEIGPGVGSLTTALAEAGALVTAVELDRHLLPVLEEVVVPLGVRVVHGDALTVDWDDVLDGTDGWSLVANLPYNVATTVVLHLLDEVPAIDSMLVMVQREVAERLAAPAGSRTYGIPSVKVAVWADADVVGRVPPTVFVPQPRVESALVRIRRRAEPRLARDPELMMGLVRQAFGQRRKMLRRSLAGVVGPEDMERAGIDPASRPEQLPVERWVALTDAIASA